MEGAGFGGGQEGNLAPTGTGAGEKRQAPVPTGHPSQKKKETQRDNSSWGQPGAHDWGSNRNPNWSAGYGDAAAWGRGYGAGRQR